MINEIAQDANYVLQKKELLPFINETMIQATITPEKSGKSVFCQFFLPLEPLFMLLQRVPKPFKNIFGIISGCSGKSPTVAFPSPFSLQRVSQE